MSATVLFGLKALLHVTIGPDAYDYKVSSLRNGNDVDQLGAWLLQTDPLTLALANRIRRVLN